LDGKESVEKADVGDRAVTVKLAKTANDDRLVILNWLMFMSFVGGLRG
jgi:hypothetical protein